MSWYVYCSNNPLTRTDPTGLFDVSNGFSLALKYIGSSALKGLSKLAYPLALLFTPAPLGNEEARLFESRREMGSLFQSFLEFPTSPDSKGDSGTGSDSPADEHEAESGGSGGGTPPIGPGTVINPEDTPEKPGKGKGETSKLDIPEEWQPKPPTDTTETVVPDHWVPQGLPSPEEMTPPTALGKFLKVVGKILEIFDNLKGQ